MSNEVSEKVRLEDERRESKAFIQTQIKIALAKMKECWFCDAFAMDNAERKFKEGLFWIDESFREV